MRLFNEFMYTIDIFKIPTLYFTRAVDPHSFLADPDPAFFLNADPDPAALKMWIRIQL